MENPVTVAAVLESISTADTQDYPAILRQVMETLEAQNPGNWAKVRGELVEMIREEVKRVTMVEQEAEPINFPKTNSTEWNVGWLRNHLVNSRIKKKQAGG